MRDGQVAVPLPLNLNTKKAWVGQGRRDHLSGSRSGSHRPSKTFARGLGTHRKKKAGGRERFPVSDGPQSKKQAPDEDSRVARGWQKDQAERRTFEVWHQPFGIFRLHSSLLCSF